MKREIRAQLKNAFHVDGSSVDLDLRLVRGEINFLAWA